MQLYNFYKHFQSLVRSTKSSTSSFVTMHASIKLRQKHRKKGRNICEVTSYNQPAKCPLLKSLFTPVSHICKPNYEAFISSWSKTFSRFPPYQIKINPTVHYAGIGLHQLTELTVLVPLDVVDSIVDIEEMVTEVPVTIVVEVVEEVTVTDIEVLVAEVVTVESAGTD